MLRRVARPNILRFFGVIANIREFGRAPKQEVETPGDGRRSACVDSVGNRGYSHKSAVDGTLLNDEFADWMRSFWALHREFDRTQVVRRGLDG